jgi:tetratricopeptide (TPR) repeat protein/predicted Ser/Thr protein kinase
VSGRGCLGDEEVAAFVGGTLAADAADAVRAHLASCDGCREVVAHVARGMPASQTLPASPPSEIQHERGGRVGRYQTLEVLGRGGMGVVYRAYDPELARPVALKLVRADRREQDDLRKRLVREAQAMARVTHRNVLTVYDAGTVDDEVYIAMALVEGGTLRQWLRSGPRRPPAAVVERFVAAGRGLEAAHAAGVVHRDFKPDNVLVDGNGQVFVTDFGLARPSLTRESSAPSGETALSSATLTQPGAMVGTPSFMAPEQLRGEVVDARADQFSFCVALWEALAGQQPFGGGNVAERLDAIAAGPKPARMPQWIARALERGLALDPAARWPSMTALLARLEADPARKRRRRIGLALAVVAAVALPPAWWLWRDHETLNACRARQHEIDPVWNDARKQTIAAAFAATGKPHAAETWAQAGKLLDEYVVDWKKVKNNSCKTTRLKHKQTEETLAQIDACLDERLAEVERLAAIFATADGPLVNRALDAVHALPAVRECGEGKRLAREDQLPVDPALRARVVEVRRKLSEVRASRAAGRYREADEQARPLEAEVTALGHRPTEAQYWLLMEAIGGDFRVTARIRDAGRKAILAAESVPLPHVAFTAWHFLFRCAAHEGYGAAADEADAQMAAWAQSSGDEDARARLLWDRARRLNDTGHSSEAIPMLEETLKIAERNHYQGILDGVVGDLADAYYLAHRFDEARAMYQRDIRDAEAEGGPHSVKLAPGLNNLGGLLLDEHKVDEAKALFERSLALSLDAYGPDDSRVGEELNSLAAVARMQNRPAQGEKLALQATAVFEKALGRDHPRVAYGLTNVGAALVEEGRAAQAIAPLERALAIRARVESGPDERSQTFMYLGFALGDSGRDPKRARQLVDDARALFVKAKNDDDVARIDRWLARRSR